jgi:hypothetical protein
MHSYRRLDAWKHAHAALGLTEGYALGTGPLLRKRLRIALGSAAEAECLALVAGEASYLDATIVSHLASLLGDAMKALRVLLRHPPNSGG